MMSHLYWLFVALEQIDDKRVKIDLEDYIY